MDLLSVKEDNIRLNDEKPITVRQCIQSLGKIAQFKPNLQVKIVDRLISFDLMSVKEIMRKPILLDIIGVLLQIIKTMQTDETEGFISAALLGEILYKKSKKQIEKELYADKNINPCLIIPLPCDILFLYSTAIFRKEETKCLTAEKSM